MAEHSLRPGCEGRVPHHGSAGCCNHVGGRVRRYGSDPDSGGEFAEDIEIGRPMAALL